MKVTTQRDAPEKILAAIQRCLDCCLEPMLLELGQPAIPVAENIHFETRGAGVVIEAWSGEQFLSRRIRAVRSEHEKVLRSGETAVHKLELTVECFGGKTSSLVLFDAARLENGELGRKAGRWNFASLFRRMLRREFPDLPVAELATEANLHESFSAAYPRALLRRGNRGWAAIAAPPDAQSDGILSFGLVWLDYIRRRERELAIEGLAVFLPKGRERTTCLRLNHLDASAAQWAAFTYGEDGFTRAVDLADWGNFETSLDAPRSSGHRAGQPEAAIEQQLREQIQVLDARLRPDPVYGQVPAFAGGDRDILDLLAVDYSGRLTVIEVKATESIHLPLQALDYWMRVGWHLGRGDFERSPYFRGIGLRQEPVRLLLAAPAMEFHPTSERILRFFAPGIEVEMIGLAGGWGTPLRLMYRHGRNADSMFPVELRDFQQFDTLK